DHGRDGEETLVLLTSGHVAKIRTNEKLLWQRKIPQQASLTHQWYDVTMDDNRYITKLNVAEAPIPSIEERTAKIQKLLHSNYVPTTVESMSKAQAYHRQGRRTYDGETQCFNRGMIWSYEW